jgi:hypothetical protein
MDREEALKQINEIKSVLERGNRIEIPGTLFILYGIFFIVSPYILHYTSGFTWGVHVLESSIWYQFTAQISFYAIFILFVIPKLALRFKETRIIFCEKPYNPSIINNMLNLEKVIFYAMWLSIIVLYLTMNAYFIFPFALIFTGIFFYFLGVLSLDKIMRGISLTNITAGAIFILLNNFLFNQSFIFAMMIVPNYLGITMLIIGHRTLKYNLTWLKDYERKNN